MQITKTVNLRSLKVKRNENSIICDTWFSRDPFPVNTPDNQGFTAVGWWYGFPTKDKKDGVE